MKPQSAPADLTEHYRLMCDLMVVAFQSDVTRVLTCMLAREGNELKYRMVGISEGHHELTHHRNDPAKIAKVRAINTYHIQQFAYLLGKLKSIPEGDGTVLDNCMITYGSGNSDGNRHTHENLPILVAGKGGGSLKTGRHILATPRKRRSTISGWRCSAAWVPPRSISVTAPGSSRVYHEARQRRPAWKIEWPGKGVGTNNWPRRSGFFLSRGLVASTVTKKAPRRPCP